MFPTGNYSDLSVFQIAFDKYYYVSLVDNIPPLRDFFISPDSLTLKRLYYACNRRACIGGVLPGASLKNHRLGVQEMNINFCGIVREVKNWDTDKEGKPIAADKVQSQITLLDRATGGDVVLSFPAGHGLSVGMADVDIVAHVRPVVRNFKLSLYVLNSTIKPVRVK